MPHEVTADEGLIASGMVDRLAAHAAAADVFERSGRSLKIALAAGEVRSVQHDQTYECSARAIVDGRAGFSSVTDRSAGDALAREALSCAPYATPVALELPGMPAMDDAERVPVHDPVTAAAELSTLREVGESMLAGLTDAFPEASHEVRVRCAEGTWRLANTSGLDHSETESHATLSLSTTITEAEDLFQCYASGASRRLADLPRLLARMLQKLAWGQRMVAPPTGRLPVVFLPEGAPILLAPLVTAAAGGTAAGKSSPLLGREGEKLLDERITLSLDPTLPFAIGSHMLDHEGIVSRELPLFEQGVFRSFFHDLTTAARCGAEPTGHGRRGRQAAPAPSPGNIVLSGGDVTFDEMIADIQDGLLVESVIGGGQGNILSGAFSNTVGVAYRIEAGVVTGRVKDVSLAGNVYELLRDQLHSLTVEQLPAGGGNLAPAIRLEGVNLIA